MAGMNTPKIKTSTVLYNDGRSESLIAMCQVSGFEQSAALVKEEFIWSKKRDFFPWPLETKRGCQMGGGGKGRERRKATSH